MDAVRAVQIPVAMNKSEKIPVAGATLDAEEI